MQSIISCALDVLPVLEITTLLPLGAMFALTSSGRTPNETFNLTGFTLVSVTVTFCGV